MQIFLASLLVLVSNVSGFVVPQFAKITPLRMSSAVEAEPFAKSERIVMDDLPIVYVYDHCPFCVRVRLALGVKNIKHTVHFMANDDVPTPTKLVGKKIAPIFVSIHHHLSSHTVWNGVTHTCAYNIHRPSQLTSLSWQNP